MSTNFLFLLLAQQNPKPPRPGDWTFGWDSVALIAAVAAAIVIVAWLISRFVAAREQKTKNSPWCLLKQLADAHALNHRERQLITRMAKQLQLDRPAVLFVESTWWEAERLGPSWTACRPELDKLRRRLFAIR